MATTHAREIELKKIIQTAIDCEDNYRKFSECTIRPASGGFGEYESGERGEAHEDFDTLVQDCMDGTGEMIFELGVDTMPSEIEDIRGKIHNQPTHVFGWIDHHDESVNYFGIDEI